MVLVNELLEEIQSVVSVWMYNNEISDIENLDIRINACDSWINPPEIINNSYKII